MRILRVYSTLGTSPQELVEEFNERAEEVGLENESDLVSVSFCAPTLKGKVLDAGSKRAVDPTVEASFVYWSNS